MYDKYEFKSDGSLKMSSNNNAYKVSLKQKIKRFILKHNLDIRVTKNTKYYIINWLGYELVLQKHWYIEGKLATKMLLL